MFLKELLNRALTLKLCITMKMFLTLKYDLAFVRRKPKIKIAPKLSPVETAEPTTEAVSHKTGDASSSESINCNIIIK